jgi:polyhydroxyalkanoate synthesis regulator phasin
MRLATRGHGNTATRRLVEVIIDSMVDGQIELPDLNRALLDELYARAEEARKNPDEYTPEELDYWRDIAAEVDRASAKAPNAAQGTIRDFLMALDSSYFGPLPGLKDTAFVDALRKEVA